MRLQSAKLWYAGIGHVPARDPGKLRKPDSWQRRCRPTPWAWAAPRLLPLGRSNAVTVSIMQVAIDARHIFLPQGCLCLRTTFGAFRVQTRGLRQPAIMATSSMLPRQTRLHRPHQDSCSQARYSKQPRPRPAQRLRLPATRDVFPVRRTPP